ncbi:hypothetical protein [Reyranella sp. CPCC 100927]|uniref:hypothetical protein n=1 Tax=Reyranella sp. CPCC 100927 TaxID=2599616 RepID=UPI0011B49BA1|nr:hypothetical protein [Reyranella sp. CPCC 100927]TWT12769.1 hypothetical protein FQU96_10975 [Reyranella sp. CPCC 100927]
MATNTLTEHQIEVVRNCLVAAIEGPFFEDWEFHTLIGIDRLELKEILEKWPATDSRDENAARNVMGNLLGYPHGQDGALLRYVSGGRTEIESVFETWSHTQDSRAL